MDDFFAKRMKKPSLCCVSTCTGEDDGTLSYHAFPKPGKKVVIRNSAPGRLPVVLDRRKIWEDRLCVDQKITKTSKVCSLHFSDEEYVVKRRKFKSRLKNTAVPNRNLPEESSAFVTFKKQVEDLRTITNSDYKRYVTRKTKKNPTDQVVPDTVTKVPICDSTDRQPTSTVSTTCLPESFSRYHFKKKQLIIPDADEIIDLDDLPDTTVPCSNASDGPNVITTEVTVIHCEPDKVLPPATQVLVDTMDMLLMHSSFELEKFQFSGTVDVINLL